MEEEAVETAVEAVIIILVIVSGIGVFKGLNPKKWSSWLYVACAFAGGMLAGLLRADVYGGLVLGALLAALILYGGAMNRWHRQRAEKMADSWLLRNEGKPYLSFLARVIRKRIHK